MKVRSVSFEVTEQRFRKYQPLALMVNSFSWGTVQLKPQAGWTTLGEWCNWYWVRGMVLILPPHTPNHIRTCESIHLVVSSGYSCSWEWIWWFKINFLPLSSGKWKKNWNTLLYHSAIKWWAKSGRTEGTSPCSRGRWKTQIWDWALEVKGIWNMESFPQKMSRVWASDRNCI